MKNKIVGSVLTAAISLAPLAAGATIVEVNYAGTVNRVDGTGLGYALNDSISGTIFIDTSLVGSTDTISPPFQANATYSPTTPYFVVGGQVGVGDTYSFSNLDQVVVTNQTAPGGADQYSVQNGSYRQDAQYQGYFYQNLYIYDYVVDFITGTGLIQSFSLTSSDLSGTGAAGGGVVDSLFDSIAQKYVYENAVFYDLSRISVAIAPSPTSVPEPGTLTLMAAGLFGIFLLGRRRLA